MSHPRSQGLAPRTRPVLDSPRTTRPRTIDEAPALARLTFEELGDAVGGIGSMHRAIADRAFGASGRGAQPVKVAHDAISGGVYAALRGGARLVGRGAEEAVRQRRRSHGRELSATPRGAMVLGVIHGLMGDRLEDERSELQQPLSV